MSESGAKKVLKGLQSVMGEMRYYGVSAETDGVILQSVLDMCRTDLDSPSRTMVMYWVKALLNDQDGSRIYIDIRTYMEGLEELIRCNDMGEALDILTEMESLVSKYYVAD